MNALQEAHAIGQSIWLDGLDRELLDSGRLAELIGEGVRGVTTDFQTIDSAIAQFHAGLASGAVVMSVPTLYESLLVKEVRRVADLLQPLYEHTRGHDGLVSMEIPPDLAHDAAGTIQAASRLWQAVDRRNLMIKVPGTLEGLVAIEDLIASGINVNATLLFSVQRCAEVREAYCRGLERLDSTVRPKDVAAVASLFLSRIDATVDRQLDLLGTAQARALRGRSAIACARLAYHEFVTFGASSRWEKLGWLGARPQRLLWAWTSAKDPTHGELKYVEAVIAAQTVATLPWTTLDAFRRCGHVQALNDDIAEAQEVLRALAVLGINPRGLAGVLETQSLDTSQAAYSASLDKLGRRVSLTSG